MSHFNGLVSRIIPYQIPIQDSPLLAIDTPFLDIQSTPFMNIQDNSLGTRCPEDLPGVCECELRENEIRIIDNCITANSVMPTI